LIDERDVMRARNRRTNRHAAIDGGLDRFDIDVAARSRITNGVELLPGVDGRSQTARRYHGP
jgi:hypothetical protein